jgi:hypothetical protein
VTATFLLNEPLIKALVARLQADLPTVVAAVNAEARDDIELRVPNPEHILEYVPAADLLTEFPTIGIQELPTDIVDDIGSSFTGVHRLAIIVFATHVELRGLAWSLRRYMQAITTVMLDTRQIGDAWGVVAKGTVPGQTLERAEHPRTYMSWAGVRLEAKRDETG